MKFKLKNIGNYEAAEIELKKITVLAGKNSTGKSTILKSIEFMLELTSIDTFYSYLERELGTYILESILSSLFKLEKKCIEKKFIRKQEIINEDIEKFLSDRITTLIDKLKSSNGKEVFEKDAQNILNNLKKELLMHIEGKIEFDKISLEKIFAEIEEKIKIGYIKRDIPFFYERPIRFAKRRGYLNIIKTEPPYILSVKRGLSRGDISMVNSIGSVSVNWASRENPDYVRSNNYECFMHNVYDFTSLSIRQSFENKMNYDNMSIIKEKEYFLKIERIIEDVIKDSLIDVPLYSYSSGYKTLLKLKNIPGLLKYDENYFIFDEVESNLDPENQLIYARILVLLAKYLNINIILTSHSGYFLEAIELYTILEKMENDVNFYLTFNDEKNDRFCIANVNDDLNRLYQHFLNPYKNFDKIRKMITENKLNEADN